MHSNNNNQHQRTPSAVMTCCGCTVFLLSCSQQAYDTVASSDTNSGGTGATHVICVATRALSKHVRAVPTCHCTVHQPASWLVTPSAIQLMIHNPVHHSLRKCGHGTPQKSNPGTLYTFMQRCLFHQANTPCCLPPGERSSHPQHVLLVVVKLLHES